jgi:hypothetical protein
VQTTAQVAAGSDYVEMTTIISTSGFEMKRAHTPQGLLQPVQNLRRLLTRSLGANKVKLKWDLPLGVTSIKNIHNYRVSIGTTADFSASTEIGYTSKTTFIDTNTTNAPVQRFYWIEPLGAAGLGAVSNAICVTLASA